MFVEQIFFLILIILKFDLTKTRKPKTNYLLSKGVFAKLFSNWLLLFLLARNQHPSEKPCYLEECYALAKHYRL